MKNGVVANSLPNAVGKKLAHYPDVIIWLNVKFALENVCFMYV